MAFKKEAGCRKTTPVIPLDQVASRLARDQSGWRLAECPETRVPILLKEFVTRDFGEGALAVSSSSLLGGVASSSGGVLAPWPDVRVLLGCCCGQRSS
jgi:hypothetical protein